MILKKNVIYDLYEGEYYGRENVVAQMTNPKPLAINLRASWQQLGARYRAEDIHVVDFVNQCKASSVKYGLYHFLTPNGIAEQAALFMSVWNKCGGADLQPIVDVEVDLNTYYPKLVNGRVVANASSIGNLVWQGHVKTFLDLISLGTGKTPMIYTSKNYWAFTMTKNLLGQLVPPTWTADYPLWVAQYFDNPDSESVPTAIPNGWNEYKIWQYSEKGGSNGFLANDLNTATDKYAAELGAIVIDPPTPDPEPDSIDDPYVSAVFTTKSGKTETWKPV